MFVMYHSSPVPDSENMRDLAACIHEALAAVVPAEDIDAVTLAAVHAVWHRFRGSLLYVPIGRRPIEARNEAIREAFDGGNHLALARQFGMALQTIYSIIGAGKERRRYAKKPRQTAQDGP